MNKKYFLYLSILVIFYLLSTDFILAKNPIFSRTLQRGSSGIDVEKLQEFFKKTPDIYPKGIVTGYFGPLTQQAVQRFQSKYGIVSSGDENTTGYGLVGPKTRKRLNELAGPQTEMPQATTTIAPQASSSPPVSTTTHPTAPKTPPQSPLSSDPYGPRSPYQHSVMSAVSVDGLNWMIDEKFKTIEHISVPSAILRPDGAIMLYFVDFRDALDSKGWDTTDCMISSNGVDFQNADCKIQNLASPKAWDPAPLYINGEYRLYYFASGLPSRNHEIHVATSSDGVNFTEAGSVFGYTDLVDPDVIFFKNTYLMYVYGWSDSSGSTMIAESQDGKNFQKSEKPFIKDCGSTKPVEYGPGKLRVYCFWQKGQDAGKVVSAVSTDGFNFTLESGTRLAISGKSIADPYVIRMPDNTWRMYFKVQSTEQISSSVPISRQCIRYKIVRGQISTSTVECLNP